MREYLTINYLMSAILVADDITFMEGLLIIDVALNFILFVNEQEQIVLDCLHQLPQRDQIFVTIAS